MKVQNIFNKPHPFIFNRYSVLLPSFATFIVLVILKPFEFDTFQTSELIAWSSFFAFLVGVTVFTSVGVLKRFFRKTIEDNWSVAHEVLLFLFVLAVISLALFVLFLNLNPEANRLELFLLVVFRTLAISFFPVLILVLYEQNHHQGVKRRQAEKLNQELLKSKNSLMLKKTPTTSPSKIVLQAENEKVSLQIEPVDLFFIKSAGNYVEVFYSQNRDLRKELIRNSLKAIENQLPEEDFFRCHKRFLVNLQHIQKVDGNARSLELTLAGIEEKISVSRSKSDILLQLFQQKA